MNSPAVSVIMAVYNTASFLDKAIGSVIGQTFTDWELICVNDGSTDDSSKILDGYASIDSRIKVIHQTNSGNASKVRNIALQFVSGRYVFVLDSDDYISSDCLMNCVDKAIQESADCVMPDLLMFDDKSGVTSMLLEGLQGDRNLVLSSQAAVEYSLTWKISGTALWDSALVKQIGYDSSGMNGDEYTTRVLLSNCNKIVFCKGIYYYRLHNNSTTRRFSVKMMKVYPVNFKLLKFLEDNDFSQRVINGYKLEILKDIVFRYAKFIEFQNILNTEERKECNQMVYNAYDYIVAHSSIKEVSKIANGRDRFLLSLFYPNFGRFKILAKTFVALKSVLKPIARIFFRR